MKNKKFKLLLLTIVIILIYQIIYITFDNSGYKSAKEKAIIYLNEKKTEINEQNIQEQTKIIRRKELLTYIKNRKSRLFVSGLSNDEKQLLIKELTEKLDYSNITNKNDVLHELKVIKEGYNIVNYTTEKIFKLTSIRQTEYALNYFIIIISVILLALSIILRLIFKNKFKKDTVANKVHKQ